ncbi:hypothetical protein GOP47_0029200 [Adiantum capillus-veneris]|nr:hypothetical protein GOP47_0029200 [Adiantum capillus-veneris]
MANSNSTCHDLVTRSCDFDATADSLHLAASSLQDTVEGLVTCYSSAASSNAHFCKLRTRLTSSAFLYRDLHLPLSTQLVNNISNLMNMYDSMDAVIFCDHIAVVAREVKRYADHATKVIDVHVRLLEDLNKLDMDAKTTLEVLVVEETDRTRQAEAYEKKGKEIAEKEESMGAAMFGVAAVCTLEAVFFAGVPVMSSLFGGGAVLTGASSARKIQKAKDELERFRVLSIAEKEEAKMAYHAATTIRVTLIAAVGNFVQAVTKVAGFLQTLEGDVSNYAANANRMATNKDTMVIYLGSIKTQSRKIQDACGNYLKILPHVQGRLGALVQCKPSDPNHIQQWLALKFSNEDHAAILKLTA